MLAGWIAGFSRFREPTARLTLLAIGCYVSVGIALYLFPRKTWIHHWVLGTPFHYVAIGLGLESLKRLRADIPGFLLRVVVGATGVVQGALYLIHGCNWTFNALFSCLLLVVSGIGLLIGFLTPVVSVLVGIACAGSPFHGSRRQPATCLTVS